MTGVHDGRAQRDAVGDPRGVPQVDRPGVEQFDAFVIPLANAFRPEFEHRLANLTSLVRGLTIPVVVVGVGAQAGLHDDMPATGLDDTVKAFAAAVLDRSASVGVPVLASGRSDRRNSESGENLLEEEDSLVYHFADVERLLLRRQRHVRDWTVRIRFRNGPNVPALIAR